ncbi:hypothetical protein MGN01_09870 [Methylobacterium gnaphalii]|uniref:Uncharacterized protein n=1 Tax=Methylobacterium gnaphalii TaxID=1010610 RepID=A0A512JH15_9HYPH|nr:hypothetical protein MGN01_09870 [Methylobacterium gnaphalii]
MQSTFVALVLPADGEATFFVPRKKWRLHRGPNELTPNPCDFRHPRRAFLVQVLWQQGYGNG